MLKDRIPPGVRKSIKANRARAFEAVGSHRYSTPANGGVDLHVAALLPPVGVFLEVGANDGYSQSNTYYLERVKGWNGILIEPIPDLYQRCKRLRSRSFCVHAACVAEPAPPGTMVDLIDCDLTSTAPALVEDEWLEHRQGRTVQAPARTVSEIIDASPHDRVDFMSVDVEGSELALLSGLDWTRHAPGWLLIEVWQNTDLIDFLDPHMRLVERLNERDVLLRRRGD